SRSQLQSSEPEAAKQYRERTPVNIPGGGDRSSSGASSADEANAVADLKKDSTGEAAPPAAPSSPSAPAPMPALAAPKTRAPLQNQRVARAESTADEKDTSLDTLRPKTPGPQPNTLGGVVAG